MLDLAEVGEGSIVAAGAVVLEKTVIGPGELWAGVPARFVKKIDPDKARSYARHYCQYKQSLSPAPDGREGHSSAIDNLVDQRFLDDE